MRDQNFEFSVLDITCLVRQALNRISTFFESLVHYLVGLLQSVEQGLEPRKVSNQFEQPQNPHHPNQPDDLSCFPDYLVVLQTLEEDGDVERDDGGEVDDVERVLDEPQLVGTDDQTEQVFHSEKDHYETVDELDGEGDVGELDVALLVLLQLLHGGEDEGGGGDDHHRQREDGHALGQLAGNVELLVNLVPLV